MKKQVYFAKAVYWTIVCMLILSGCSGSGKEQAFPVKEITEGITEEQVMPAGDEEKAENPQAESRYPADSDGMVNLQEAEPEIVEADWSEYFDGLNGAAVVYKASDRQYMMYNRETAMTQTSPCSTFKIISSLIALESGMIDPENSVRRWSGEIFWNENWNHDIDFREAFRSSCVWYFREVINETGREKMQEELDKLKYGNCDISDWEGRLNTNNNNRALTGFWIESSLKISPKEQAEVMAQIFGADSIYSEETQNQLRQVMLTEEQSENDISVYGKTGMGKAQGVVVDAWFTGFAESREQTVYFCVYLGRTDGRDVSSAGAKEIAIHLVTDLLQ